MRMVCLNRKSFFGSCLLIKSCEALISRDIYGWKARSRKNVRSYKNGRTRSYVWDMTRPLMCDLSHSYVRQYLGSTPWTLMLTHTAAHCHTLQHTATKYNTLQHTAIYCNTLQHSATDIPRINAWQYCESFQKQESSKCNSYDISLRAIIKIMIIIS